MSVQSLTLRRPDDWHVHLRDGVMLAAVLPYTAAQFGRAIVMPNLKPPITTAALASAYRARILAALPKGSHFQPLMTCYLTNDTDPADLIAGQQAGIFTAAKLYPANATTNSAHGVTDIKKIARVLEAMQKSGLPLLIHGEVTDPAVDIFDREAVFIETILRPLLADFPALRVVLEHITTAQAVAFVRAEGPSGRLAATITAHHLLINRSDIFAGGIRPHLYCLPVAKRERHRLALVEAATSGEPWFFLGTDTAPHSIATKEAECGCAGIFTAANALELYAEAFDAKGALDRLEGFASLHGPAFYRLPVNEEKITLVRQNMPVPLHIQVDHQTSIKPFRAGEVIAFSYQKDSP